jgi:hypothetical protein
MSPEVLLNTYGHHHPGYLSDAVEKNAVRGPANERKAHVSGAVIPTMAKVRLRFRCAQATPDTVRPSDSAWLRHA